METQLRFEGHSVEEALGKARSVCGSDAKIVFARRIATKGFFGLGVRYRFEVVAEPSTQNAKPQESHHRFAEELRDALRFDATTESAPYPSRRRNPKERYAEAASLGGTDKADTQEQEDIALIDLNGQAVDPSHVRVFKRDGSKSLSKDVTPPPWIGAEPETQRGLSDQYASMDEPFDDYIDRNSGGGEADRFRALRSRGWTGLVDLQSTPAVIDLTSDEPVVRFPESKWGQMAEGTQLGELTSRFSVSLELLHELPIAPPGSVVILAGRQGFDQGHTFSSLSDTYGVRECDRFVFASSDDVGIWSTGDSSDPRDLLHALDMGRTVSLWIDDLALSEVTEALIGYPTLNFCQVDVSCAVSDSETYLSSLSQVDGLCVTGMARCSDPLAILGLGIPVATLDGRVSSVGAWVKILSMKGVA